MKTDRTTCGLKNEVGPDKGTNHSSPGTVRREYFGKVNRNRKRVFIRRRLQIRRARDISLERLDDCIVVDSHDKMWKQYVRHRVKDIHRLTDKESWRFCPGSENPADLPSRGTTATDLSSNTL